QVNSGKDHSANFVLAPAILNEVSKVKSIVDIGCGTGWLTKRVAKYSDFLVGIDPSKESIAIGRARHSAEGISYYEGSVESYVQSGKKFELAISNMAASSAPDINTFLMASREILVKGSYFIFTIPHPFFWSVYWGYSSHPSFRYEKSCAIEAEFKIQGETSSILTTHFHHPLEQYFKALTSSRLDVVSIRELIGRGFDLPRFMLIKCRAI
ncbi:MAG: class I SAM-dependent methyltransferase, partial [Pedobacter sp.]